MEVRCTIFNKSCVSQGGKRWDPLKTSSRSCLLSGLVRPNLAAHSSLLIASSCNVCAISDGNGEEGHIFSTSWLNKLKQTFWTSNLDCLEANAACGAMLSGWTNSLLAREDNDISNERVGICNLNLLNFLCAPWRRLWQTRWRPR